MGVWSIYLELGVLVLSILNSILEGVLIINTGAEEAEVAAEVVGRVFCEGRRKRICYFIIGMFIVV